MKYIARFIGGLDYIKNGMLSETDTKGRKVTKGAYGRGHFGGDQGFVPNWRAKNFHVNLPQSQIDDAIQQLQLIHNDEYLSTADGKKPTDPAWSNLAMRFSMPFTGKIFDTENAIDNLWLAILRNDPEIHFLDSEAPASMHSIRWTVEVMKENVSYGDDYDHSAPMVDFNVILSEASMDDQIEALLYFKDYTKEFLTKLTRKELTKHLFMLFEENTMSKFNQTVLFTLDQVVNKTEIQYSVDKIFSNAIDEGILALSGGVFSFGDIVIGQNMQDAKEFLGKPENRDILKQIEDTIA